MNRVNSYYISVRLCKFDDYIGPLCLNDKMEEGCTFCVTPCNGSMSSKVIMDALKMENEILTFEEINAMYQATYFLVRNSDVRGGNDKYSIIFKLDKNRGRIRTDLLMKIRDDFTERLKETDNQVDSSFADMFCKYWEEELNNLTHVTEHEEERLRTQKALANANEILTANNIIVKFDVNGKLTFLNPFAEKFFGYAADEIIGQHIVGTGLPKFNPYGNSNREIIAKLIQHPEQFERMESVLNSKDGTQKWVIWVNKPLYGVSGRLIEILSVGVDVTPLKKTEQRLEVEKALSQLYFDVAGVILVVLNTNFEIVKINKKGLEILEYDIKELTGLKWYGIIVSSNDSNKEYHDLKDVSEGIIEITESYVLTKNSKKRRIRWHNTVIYNEKNEYIGILRSGEDNSEKYKVEKRLRKERAVKDLKDTFMPKKFRDKFS